MCPPDLPEITPIPRRNPVESGVGSGLDSALQGLTIQAFQLRSQHHYALHPVEAALQYHRAHAEIPGKEGHGDCSFEEAEAHYRAGSQGIRLPEIPQLPQQLRELSRLATVDRSGRKALRKWAEEHDHVIGENLFLQHWKAQGQRGGANTYISLARLGTWAAIKLADVGYPTDMDTSRRHPGHRNLRRKSPSPILHLPPRTRRRVAEPSGCEKLSYDSMIDNVSRMKYAALVKAIHSATAQLQGRAAVAVNQALILRNWLVGAWVLDFEQHGKDRAKYGERLLESLAKDLSINGLEIRNLRNCRLFYAAYPQIRQTLSAEFPKIPVSGDTVPRIPVVLSPEITAITPIRQTVSAESPTALPPGMLLKLSWSHLVELIAIDDPWKRAFFENECLLANWSVRQLRRQIGSLLYRLLRLPLPRRPAIRGKTPPLPRSRPRTHRKPHAAAIQAIGTFAENHQVLFFTCHPEHAGELQSQVGAKNLQMAE